MPLFLPSVKDKHKKTEDAIRKIRNLNVQETSEVFLD